MKLSNQPFVFAFLVTVAHAATEDVQLPWLEPQRRLSDLHKKVLATHDQCSMLSYKCSNYVYVCPGAGGVVPEEPSKASVQSCDNKGDETYFIGTEEQCDALFKLATGGFWCPEKDSNKCPAPTAEQLDAVSPHIRALKGAKSPPNGNPGRGNPPSVSNPSMEIAKGLSHWQGHCCGDLFDKEIYKEECNGRSIVSDQCSPRSDADKCPVPEVPNAGTKGDPHFTTWLGEKFDYHGECDLELMSDPDFNHGQGLTVHIRTTIVDDWSYVEAAAIKIGDDILEVQGSTSDAPYWMNGEYQAPVTSLGGFEVHQRTTEFRQRFFIKLTKTNNIEIRTSLLGWVSVDVKRPVRKLLGNVVGMYGSYATGSKLGRDGVTVFEEDNEFGQEWQVPGDAPMLFQTARAPQAPEKCILPSERLSSQEQARLRRRKLNALVSYDIASEACSQGGIPQRDFDDCVKDVMAVDDVRIAEDYMEDDDGDDNIIRSASVYMESDE